MIASAVFLLVISLVPRLALAGTLYQYVDKNGVVVFTDTPPEKYEKKAKPALRYRDPTPKEIAHQEAQERQRGQKYKMDNERERMVREASERQAEQQRQQADSRREREKQRQINNEAADRLEAASNKHIPGARGQTKRQRDEATQAEAIRINNLPEDMSESEKQRIRNESADRLDAAATKSASGSRGPTRYQGEQTINAARIRSGQQPLPPSPDPRIRELVPGGCIEEATGDFCPDIGGGYNCPKEGYIPK